MSNGDFFGPGELASAQREAILTLTQHGEELPWPKRQPLPPLRREVPSMPSALVPTVFRPWVEDEAERLGVCREFLAVPAVIAAGSLLGRNLTIRPKALDSWTVAPNLWGILVGRPSSMKSPAASAALAPLRRLAAEAYEDYRAAREVARARLDLLNARRAAAVKKAAAGKLSTEAAEAVLRDLDAQIAEAERSGVRRRFIVNDATVEALTVILAENPRGVFLERDELSGFFLTLRREGHEADRPFYIEAYEGGIYGGYESDRIARGNTRAPGPCLSFFGTIQPGRLDRLVRGAVGGRGEADGFLQRFQLTVWPDVPGDGHGVDREPNEQASSGVLRVFRALDLARPETFAATLEDGALPYLHFDAEGQDLFRAWLDDHHRTAKAADLARHPAFEEYLVKQRKTVPALALIFHVLSVAAGDRRPSPVGAEFVALAADWAEFLRLHAEKMYAVELRENVAAAHALAARLEAKAVPDGLTVSDLTERDWAGLDESGLVHAAVAELEAVGWVRRVLEPTGGRTRTVIRVHPDFRQGVAS